MTITIGLGAEGTGPTNVTPLKPDGTPVQANIPIPSNITKGIANRITPTLDSVITPKATISPSASSQLPPTVPNPLESFASVNHLWTLASLTPGQYNDPASYRNNPAALGSNIVFASAGRFSGQRVRTYSGTPEYFVNNFTMQSIIAPNAKTGNSNAMGYTFDIFEPYSMGQLLESMQLAAINAGHLSYIGSPFVLRLDMVGYDENGTMLNIIKPKFFTIHFTDVKFKVTEAGSNYKVKAIPYDNIAQSDVYNTSYRDLKLVGGKVGTVEEILRSGERSLVAALNKIEQELLSEGRIGIADIYDIEFPTDSSDIASGSSGVGGSATVNPSSSLKSSIGKKSATSSEADANEIGKASLNFNAASSGHAPFGDPDKVYDEKTGTPDPSKLKIDAKNRSFMFPQETRLTDIITQVIISSDYGQKATQPKNIVDGMVKWFMINVQIELLEMDPKIGDYAKKFTFRVVPYLIHQSVNTNPNSVPDYEPIKPKICKGYNYIYTGQNTNVLKFDIDVNNLFFIGTNSSPEQRTGKTDPNTAGIAEKLYNDQTASLGTAQGASTGLRGRVRKDPSQLSRPSGGSGDTTTQREVSEAFHRAFLSGASADTLTVNLEILGDPYWIVQSGTGNYFSPADKTYPQMTQDNEMNYLQGDVYVYIRFRTPIDLREENGVYQFGSNDMKDTPFSGIFRVTQCDSIFADGTFKQKLTCIRMPGQSADVQDVGKLKSDAENSLAIKIGDYLKPKTSINDGKAQPQKEVTKNANPISATPSMEMPKFNMPGVNKIASSLSNAIPGLDKLSNAVPHSISDIKL